MAATKICPYCHNEIADEAILCKYCHNLLIGGNQDIESAVNARRERRRRQSSANASNAVDEALGLSHNEQEEYTREFSALDAADYQEKTRAFSVPKQPQQQPPLQQEPVIHRHTEEPVKPRFTDAPVQTRHPQAAAPNDSYYDEALERIEVLEKQVHKVMDSISSLAKEPNPEFQFCFSPMEFSLFSYYYNPEDRDIFLLPYDYVSLLVLKSQTNFYLHNYDEARSAMKKALEYNPVSVDVHFLLADMDAAMNNYYSYHADLDRAYTFLYKEQDFFKFYRLLAKYYQATEHNEQLISLLEDLGDEKGGNNLYHRFLLLPDKSKALLDEYKIPYDASDEVIKTCINSAKDALDKDDIKTYKYYYQILINFRNDRAISNLLHNN